MKWPFGKDRKKKVLPIGPVVLSDEEMHECEDVLRAMLPEKDGGHWCIKEELLDSFRASTVALCMMGRAERFLRAAGCGSLSVPLVSPWITTTHTAGQVSQTDFKNEACKAAAKACAVFPVSIYFYDCGCVLQQTGRSDEAKEMFREFLRRVGTEALDPIMQSTLNQRDVEQAIQHARQRLELSL